MDNALAWEEKVRLTQVGSYPGLQLGRPWGNFTQKRAKISIQELDIDHVPSVSYIIRVDKLGQIDGLFIL